MFAFRIYSECIQNTKLAIHFGKGCGLPLCGFSGPAVVDLDQIVAQRPVAADCLCFLGVARGLVHGDAPEVGVVESVVVRQLHLDLIAHSTADCSSQMTVVKEVA